MSPRPMKVGVLTAALQELTPRETRQADPDQAILDWIEYGRRLGADCLQLAAAMPPHLSDIPAEALLDPVADHLNVAEPFTASRAERINEALAAAGITVSDLGYFDNHLHSDAVQRRNKAGYMLNVMDAAVLLGVPAVCCFVGRNPLLDLDQNMDAFSANFVPLLEAARDRGLVLRVEHCPMPGWDTSDSSLNNIAYCPEMWVRLWQIADAAGVGAQFKIHYDPSHSILLGMDSRSVFKWLRDRGVHGIVDGFHVKGQIINAAGLTGWGFHGQTVQRGDRQDGVPASNPSARANAWLKQVATCEHELPGTARHDPLAYLQNRTVDWFDLLIAAREELGVDPERVPLIIEHEYGPARVQDPHKLAPILQGSISFIRGFDSAAAAQWSLWEAMEAQGIPVQGRGREAYRS